MSTLSNLWSEYWWILPLVLMALCMLGCRRAHGGRGGCCSGWTRYRPDGGDVHGGDLR